MKTRIYISILFSLSLIANIEAQNYIQIKYKNETQFNYADFDKRGEYRKNLPFGKWQDISRQGIIYKEYYYDSIGQPSGTWTFNFPDGTTREQVEFAKNVAVRIKRFNLGGGEFFDIRFNEQISDTIYLGFQKIEEEIFIAENTEKQIKFEGFQKSRVTFEFDPYLTVAVILDYFSACKINCDIDIWNSKGKLWKSWSYRQGGIYEIYYNYNKKNTLVSQTEYKNKKKIKKTKF